MNTRIEGDTKTSLDRALLYAEAAQQKKAQHAEDLNQALADYRKSKAELEAVLVPVRARS